MRNYKNIHIGSHIKRISEIRNLSMSRACSYFKCSQQDIIDIYNQKTLDSGLLLKWCKLLDYNFFMFYHTHLQLYKPSASSSKLSKKEMNNVDEGYVFRKNIYSPDIIDWILNKWQSGELTPQDIMKKYKIPRTTLYRWRKREK